jgi:hypothetical protein
MMPDKVIQELAEELERVAFEAMSTGTSVFKKKYVDGSGVLYICGENCNGFKPSASDPLAQSGCPLRDPHCRAEGKYTKTCYRPWKIDQCPNL